MTRIKRVTVNPERLVMSHVSNLHIYTPLHLLERLVKFWGYFGGLYCCGFDDVMLGWVEDRRFDDTRENRLS